MRWPLQHASGTADATGVTFRLADRPRRLAGVRLLTEIAMAGSPDSAIAFDRVGPDWFLRLDQPDVERMEYLIEVTDHNSRTHTLTDPDNPRRAPGAFGDKSVVEFAGYRAPAWLADAPPAADVDAGVETHSLPGPGGESMEVGLWSPSVLDASVAAPLLAVHDGPEFAALAGFVRFVAGAIAAGALPPLRVALLGPGERNAWYAANDDYAAALCDDVLPALAPATVRVGVGASLGALAMLHAHHRHPGTFDGLFLQSGSFFTPSLDAQESGFAGFAAVTGFVAALHDTAPDGGSAAPVPAVLTCGTVEENLVNNEAMAASLARLGYPVALHRVRDAHNFVAWRDALDPHLTDLVRAVCDA